MGLITLKEEQGLFCPVCGSILIVFGRKSRRQYRCLENKHYTLEENAKTRRQIDVW